MVQFFQQNKLLFLLLGILLPFISLFLLSKFIHQEIIKDHSFSMPTLDISKDNGKDKAKNQNQGTERLAAVQQRVEYEKSQNHLNMQDKGYKTYQLPNLSNRIEVKEKLIDSVKPNSIPAKPVLSSPKTERTKFALIGKKTPKVQINNDFSTESSNKTEPFNTTILSSSEKL